MTGLMVVRMKKSVLAGNLLLYCLILVCLILFGADSTQDKISYCRGITCLALAAVVADYMTLMSAGVRIFSIAGMFVAFSWLFHFGLIIIDGWVPDYRDYVAGDPFAVFDQAARACVSFSFIAIQFAVSGITLGAGRTGSQKTHCGGLQNTDRMLKRMAFVILAVSLPMRIRYDLMARRALHTSYLEVFELNVSGVYIQVSLFYIIGFVLLLLAYRRSRPGAFVILAGELLFLVAEMFTGARFYSVTGILVILYCYFTVIQKTGFRQWLILIPAAGILMQIIMAVSAVRSGGAFSVSALAGQIRKENTKVLLRILDESGWTIYTVYKTVSQVPEQIPYAKGSTYLYGLSQIFVNIGGILNEVTEKATYNLQLKNMVSAGGSYIGELYFNFGYAGCLVAGAAGWLTGKISSVSERMLASGNYTGFAYFVMPCIYTMMWVRGQFTTFVRGTVWAAVLILCLHRLLRAGRSSVFGIAAKYKRWKERCLLL